MTHQATDMACSGSLPTMIKLLWSFRKASATMCSSGLQGCKCLPIKNHHMVIERGQHRKWALECFWLDRVHHTNGFLHSRGIWYPWQCCWPCVVVLPIRFSHAVTLMSNYVHALLDGCLSPRASEKTIVGTNLIKWHLIFMVTVDICGWSRGFSLY